SSNWSGGSWLMGRSRKATRQPACSHSSSKSSWWTELRARRSGAVSTTWSHCAAATASRKASRPGRRNVEPLTPSSRKTNSSRTSQAWSAHHARKRASCCSLVCWWACRWVDTRTYKAVRIVFLLVSIGECLEMKGSQGAWGMSPLEQEVVRLVPPTLPTGRERCLATQAPGAFHEPLLAECPFHEHSCEEGTSAAGGMLSVSARGAVTRSA